MNKLEEKLLELGYKNYFDCYVKRVNGYDIYIEPYDKRCSKLHKKYVYNHRNYFDKQKQMDNLQQAFDTMLKDLEVLKEYEM